MLKLHLREPGYTFSGCVPFTKLHERSQKFRETCNLKHIYKNELDKACFVHGTAYSNSKDLAKRTILDNLKYDGCQRGLVSMIYTFFLKKKQDQEQVQRKR